MSAANKEESKKADVALGIWMIMGINVGVAIGVSVDNLGAGIAIGMGLGISTGMLARMMIIKKSRDAAEKTPE